MTLRRQASPLHAARAGASAAYCLALGTGALLSDHPLVLAVLLVACLGAGRGARCLDALAHTARFAVPLALLIALANPFVAHYGLTVLARLGDAGPLGQLDLTLESLVFGGVLALKFLVIVFSAALFGAVVDPQEALGLLRRVAPRSALAGVLAVRLVPVLARDAARLDLGRRCRADGGGTGPAARLTVVRATASGALDRAVDVAATLEVRGYGAGPSRGVAGARPWSRHDLAFAAAAVVLLGALVAARLAGVAAFAADPQLRGAVGPSELVLVAVVLLAGGLPFADRRGIA